MRHPSDITIEYRACGSDDFFVHVRQGEHMWTGMGGSIKRAQREALRKRKRQIKHDARYHGGKSF